MGKPVPPPKASWGGIKYLAGAAGFALPVVAAPWPVDNLLQMGPLANRLLTHPVGRVAVRGSQIGGAIAAGNLAWQYREDLGHAGARTLQTITIGRYQAPTDAWENTPKDKWQKRGGRDAKAISSGKHGRFGDGPSLSLRTSRGSPNRHKRRCKHRNKAGKRCVRPAGHSGRHRYK